MSLSLIICFEYFFFMRYKFHMEQQTKQELLEQALDNLCKAIGRDITVFLPEDKDEVVPYLKKEIIKTAEAIK